VLPVNYDLDAYRGDTWSQGFRFLRDTTPVDLTGATLKSEARAPDGTSTTLIVQIDDATDGRFGLRLPTPVPPPGRYEYDIELTEPGNVISTWVKGALNVVRDVTNEL